MAEKVDITSDPPFLYKTCLVVPHYVMMYSEVDLYHRDNNYYSIMYQNISKDMYF